MKSLLTLLTLLLILCPAAAQAPLPPGLYAIFYTEQGDITAKLDEKYTPIAVSNFIALAQGVKPWYDFETRQMVKRPLYENVPFHRVIPGEMIQAGPSCGVRIHDEFLPGLRFDRAGMLAVANTGDPDTGGCQFFITTGPVPRWNQKYTIFGKVVSGQEVANKINHEPVKGDKPVNPVMLISVSIRRVAK